MRPSDLTGLALQNPGVAVVLAVTWLLLFVPTAKLLVRPATDAFLRSLPAPRIAPRVARILALVGLQLPWLALWVLGEQARGLAIVVAWTLVIVAVASVQLHRRHVRTPHWGSSLAALTSIYARALVRSATDALARGIGLALLAGIVGGLFIRNNGAVDARAAVLGTAPTAVILIPAWTGALLPLVEARRATMWLQLSLGMTTLRRTLALAIAVAAVHVTSFAIAIIAAAVTSSCDAATFAQLAIVAVCCALGAAGLTTRAVLHADRDEADAPRDMPRRGQAATRIVVGAIAAAGVIVIVLSALSAEGALLVLALGISALVTARAT